MYVYYTYTYIIKLCQRFFIYNKEAQFISCAQMPELPQSHFGDNWEGEHIVFSDQIYVMPILLL